MELQNLSVLSLNVTWMQYMYNRLRLIGIRLTGTLHLMWTIALYTTKGKGLIGVCTDTCVIYQSVLEK